ncbi:MAG TPA: RecQ family ATP-dependent DNA helicase, partial [Acidimicrobiia bacterium]
MESTATPPDTTAGAPGALDALRAIVGDEAEFRAGQLEAITALVADRRRVLCVQRTGWGKSAVYFVATKLLRDQGAGPTLLVSPLLALMRNQISQAARGGVRAVTINSDNKDDWQAIAERIAHDDVDILLISPERFANPTFRAEVLLQLIRTAGLFVIDEAHCISDWGHDFRPDYRRLARIIDELSPTVPVLCTTATANDRVVDDIVGQLGADLFVLRGPLEREALALDVVHLPSQAQRLAWLTEALDRLPGAGIIYTLTVRDCRLVAEWLQQHGVEAAAYFGGELSDAKQDIEARLQSNDLKAVVATSALGMGYDKADLAFVVHFQSPGSAIAYYQQVGRAGRGIDRAVGVLLAGTEDAQIQDWFINTAFPRRTDAEALMALLDASADPVGVTAIEQQVNLGRTRLTNMLKQLEVDGAIERVGAKYRRTDEPWEYPTERVE